MKPACTISHLTVNYDKALALWDICTALPQATLIAICGPNGAGKSTFLKALLGLVPTVGGEIAFVDGKTIGYMPQYQMVDWDFPLTVLDLVLMGCYGRVGLFSYIHKQEKQLAKLILKQVGLEGLEKRQISQLSGGQRVRAFLARALLQQADIYFLDEPFAGIDIASSQVMMQILNKLKAEGKTVVVVHHDLKEVQQSFDWTVLLNRRLVAAGPTEDVLTHELIHLAYGQANLLFDQAAQLKEDIAKGFVT